MTDTTTTTTTHERTFGLCRSCWHINKLDATHCAVCGSHYLPQYTEREAYHLLAAQVLQVAERVINTFRRPHELSGDTPEERAEDAAHMCGTYPEVTYEPGVNYRIQDSDIILTSWIAARDSEEWGDLLIVGPTVTIPIPDLSE